MIVVGANGTVDASVERVWNFMVDLDTMPLRDPSVTSVSWEPPLRVGSVSTVHFRQMGNRTGRYVVEELEPTRRLKVQLTAMGDRITGTGTWSFEPIAEDKTELSVTIQIDVRGFLKLISPFLSFSASRGARKGFDKVKNAIESRGKDSQASPPNQVDK